MWLESVLKPIRVQSKRGEVRLVPGQPVELTDDEGQQLLNQAGDKVRVVAAPPSDTEPDTTDPDAGHVWIDPPYPNPKPVFWASLGRIVGPGRIVHLAKSGLVGREQFWLIVEFEGAVRWVNADLIRSRKAFDAQAAQPAFRRPQPASRHR